MGGSPLYMLCMASSGWGSQALYPKFGGDSGVFGGFDLQGKSHMLGIYHNNSDLRVTHTHSR